MIKSAPCFKRVSMIDCYHVPISHVSGSLQIDRVFHEVIIFTTRATSLRGVHDGMRMCGVRRELCVERLGSFRSIYRGTRVGRSTRVESYT